MSTTKSDAAAEEEVTSDEQQEPGEIATERKLGPHDIVDPPDFCKHIKNIQAVRTLQQFQQLKRYMDTPERPAFFRLGASTPQTVPVLLRQAIKKLSPRCRKKYNAPDDPGTLDVDQLRDFFSKVVAGEIANGRSEKNEPGGVGKRRLSDFGNATKALLNSTPDKVKLQAAKPRYSVWAVTVDGEIRIERMDNQDPRVSYRWMRDQKRPWNLNKAFSGLGTLAESTTT